MSGAKSRKIIKPKGVMSMSKYVIYQSGGFTNCGIGYRKFSLEKL